MSKSHAGETGWSLRRNQEGRQRLGAAWKYTRLDRPWKRASEHRRSAFRLIFGRLILNHVPVFGKNSVLNAQYIGRNPIDRQTDIRKPSMDEDETSICSDNRRLIPECQRKVFNETKQSLASGRNVGAVLDVFARPEPARGLVVTFI